LVSLNPGKFLILNTDNVYPFDRKYDSYFQNNNLPMIFCGINERVTFEISRGISNEGLFPIYTTPGVHMTAGVEEWKFIGLESQPVLLIGHLIGSELSIWGPSHQTYQDIEWFRNPGCQVCQPATPRDLVMILDAIYSDPTRLPMYLRMPQMNQNQLDWIHRHSGDRKIPVSFQKGFYTIAAHRVENCPLIALISSGSLLVETLQAYRLCQENGLSAKVINLFNLSSIDSPAFLNEIQEAEFLLASIDATPSAIAYPLDRALPRSMKSKLMVRGIDDWGWGGQRRTILKRNGLDPQSQYEWILNYRN
jgi:transketolase C-terminal domain/subunit